MLTSMANLRLGKSFTGAVYQEEVLNSVLQGETIFVRAVVWNPATCTWQRGTQKVMVTGTPCTFCVYNKKGGGGFRSPVHSGHDKLSAIDRTTAKQNPTLVAFFAESQIFPSFYLTICIKTEGTGTCESVPERLRWRRLVSALVDCAEPRPCAAASDPRQQKRECRADTAPAAAGTHNNTPTTRTQAISRRRALLCIAIKNQCNRSWHMRDHCDLLKNELVLGDQLA